MRLLTLTLLLSTIGLAQPSATPNNTIAHSDTLPGTCGVGTLYHKSDWTASGKVYVCGTGNLWLQIAGGNGNAMSGTTSAIGGSLLSGGACTTAATLTITGATNAMAVVATPSADPGDGTYTKAYVSAADTVSVQVCIAVGGTPNSVTYNVRLIP